MTLFKEQLTKVVKYKYITSKYLILSRVLKSPLIGEGEGSLSNSTKPKGIHIKRHTKLKGTRSKGDFLKRREL